MLIDQLALQSTQAAVSSANAAWWTLGATIFAAISNVLVLVYIFTNQNRQEREARRRRVRIARMNLVNGIDALERAVTQRGRFSLVEVMLPRGVTSRTLARFVEAFKSSRERGAK